MIAVRHIIAGAFARVWLRIRVVAFDKEISYRTRNLSLQKDDDDDRPLTDKTVMELKIKDAMPLWLADILDENKVYPQSYSKVGNAFLKQLQGEML